MNHLGLKLQLSQSSLYLQQPLLKKGGKFLFMEIVSGTVLVGDIQDNMFVSWLDTVNWPS